MKPVKLIYFEGCPNLEALRDLLRSIPGIAIEEIRQDDLPQGDPLQRYSSPTILAGDQIIYGTPIDEAQGGCSFEAPDREKIAQLLFDPRIRKTGWLAQLASLFPAFAAWFCPACIPPLAAVFSALGIGVFAQEKLMNGVFIGGISITLVGLIWSFLKVHRNPCPLIAGVFMSGLMALGRFTELSDIWSSVLLYGGGVGLILVSFWNLRTEKACPCSSTKWDCFSCFFPKRRTSC